MIDLILRTSVILIATWVASRLLGRATAATRHLLWHSAIVTVLLAPALAPIAPTFTVPAAPGLRVAFGVIGRADVSDRRGAFAHTRWAADHDATSASASTPGTPGTLGTLGTLGAVAWPLGSFLVLVWFVSGHAFARALVRTAWAAPAAWQLEADALRARLGITRAVRVRVLRREGSPLTTGLTRATLLLPPSAGGWDLDRRRNVLLHELAHVRRGDCRVQALAQLACSVYWFNPLMWVAAAALRRERERACDDEVLRQGAQASAYAAHLLAIARGLQAAAPSAALAMARPRELEGRLLAVLSTRSRVPARGTRWALSLGIVAATLVTLGARAGTPNPAILASTPIISTTELPDLGPESPSVAERASRQSAIARAASTLQHSSSAAAREQAAMQLADTPDDTTIAPLTRALDDSSEDVREKAAMSLALQSSPRVIEPLLRALKDPSAQVREKAAIGLAFRCDPDIVEPLIAALTDRDAQVREKAAIALGTSGDARARPALEAALSDADSQVREKAVTALTLLDGSVDCDGQGTRVRKGLLGLVGALVRLAGH